MNQQTSKRPKFEFVCSYLDDKDESKGDYIKVFRMPTHNGWLLMTKTTSKTGKMTTNTQFVYDKDKDWEIK